MRGRAVLPLPSAQPHRGTAKRFKPAADVHLCMTFPAEVQGLGLIGFRMIPFEDTQVGIATVNHEPTHRR